MKTKIILAAVILFFYSLAFAGNASKDEGIPRFYLDYAIVEHSYKNDQGNFEELMKLKGINGRAAEMISNFWSMKAENSCKGYIKKLSKDVTRESKGKTSEEEKVILEKGRDKVNQCFYLYYYENWEEMNIMIKNRYQQALERQKAGGTKAPE